MIRKELPVFIVVGSLTVLLDYVTYRGLIWAELMDVHVAKGTGFIAGTLFAYVVNRFWTFGHKQAETGSLLRFVVLYGSTLAINVTTNGFALALSAGVAFGIQLAFVVATGVSAMLNFLGMKYYVFRERTS